jgi:hypothetical protein
MRYCDTVPITSTSGSLAKYIFRINSLFDPDYTGTGHQPLYRDTYAAIYELYAVVSANVKVTIVNMADVPVHCGTVFEDDTSASTVATTLMEQSNGVHRLLPALSGSLSSVTFNMKWDCQKMLGLNPYTDIGAKALFASDPLFLGALVCWAQPVDTVTVTNYLNIEIDQVVFLSNLLTPTGS